MLGDIHFRAGRYTWGTATLYRFIFCSEIFMWAQWRSDVIFYENMRPGISIVRLRYEEIMCSHLSYSSFLLFKILSCLLFFFCSLIQHINGIVTLFVGRKWGKTLWNTVYYTDCNIWRFSYSLVRNYTLSESLQVGYLLHTTLQYSTLVY
jgi:hypothetical protein